MAGRELINTMQHNDPIELLLSQAFDLLEAPTELQTEPQTIPASEYSSEQAAELRPWQQVVHHLAYDAPFQPMANLKKRLLQRISTPKNQQNTSSPLSKTISTWQKQAATATWSPYVDGITISCLDLDLTSRQIYCFVRLEPGAKFPCHRHTAPEELLMLEGNLIIDGRTYHPGDYIYSQPGSIHQPRTDDGCLVIVRASIDDQIIDDEILV